MDEEQRQLYRRIVAQTSQEFLLERMRHYGFWPQHQPLPELPEAERQELKELHTRREQLRQLQNQGPEVEEALAQERQRRWAASRQRRAERRAERQALAAARRQNWAQLRSQGIVHAGLEVSAALKDSESDLERLQELGLPPLQQADQLATALGISLGRLRWLTYHRRGAALVHYHRYSLLKPSGGERHISAPKPQLARAQQWVLQQILDKIPLRPEAHGFVAGRSILSNASPHCRQAVVVNLDLKDFFPSITFPRVRGLFAHMGYSGQIATLLALLCSEPPRVQVEIDQRRHYVAIGQRRLPQGACTSPALSNLICQHLDGRLSGVARHFRWNYTRYADDLTFSGADPEQVGRLLALVRKILQEEGLSENPSKTRVMQRGRRQEVTGLVVNQGLSVSRRERRKLRAALHQASQTGLDHQTWRHYQGLLSYYSMVDEEATQGLWRAFRTLIPRN